MDVGTAKARVVGYGSVELEVQKDPDYKDTGKMVLYAVAHMPDAVCNGFNPMSQQGDGLGQGMSFRDGCAYGQG